MSYEEQIFRELQALRDRLEQLTDSLQQSFTYTAFAKRIGVSPRTIANWVKKDRIITKQGRIPYSELRKFLT